MLYNQADETETQRPLEYVPADVDPYDADQKAPLIQFERGGKARIEVQTLQAESRVLRASTSAPGNLVLKLFNYPSWQVVVNGHQVEYDTTDQNGRVMVPIPAG